MLSSINFLFLSSLAVTSWIILCYFKHIEEQRREQIHIEYAMDDTIEEAMRQSCRGNYDIYLNFICIFACIYALAKITHITENYIGRHVQTKLVKSPNFRSLHDETGPIDDYRVRQKNLIVKITHLQREYSQLETSVQALREEKIRLAGGSDLKEAKSDGKIVNTIGQQNVYISNRHFHWTRQVYVNEDEGTVRIGSKDAEGCEPADGTEFTKIWQKYLNINSTGTRTPPTKQLQIMATDGGAMTPIVVSTEELQRMQGLY